MVRREEVRNALQEVELGDAFNGQAMGGTHRQLGGLACCSFCRVQQGGSIST